MQINFCSLFHQISLLNRHLLMDMTKACFGKQARPTKLKNGMRIPSKILNRQLQWCQTILFADLFTDCYYEFIKTKFICYNDVQIS